MRIIFTLTLVAMVTFSSGCRKDLFRAPVSNVTHFVISNPAHPMRDSVDAIVARYAAKGIPGIQVTIKNADGWYATAAGVEEINSKKPMQAGAPGWLFSLTKAYTASLVMMQQEKGKIDIDNSIKTYLPSSITENIIGSNDITVRMLLNHSSGLINFTEEPGYMLRQLNTPTKQPSLDEMLQMIYGKALLSPPGTRYFYSNSNYLLLQKILEHVSGKTYRQLLQTEIFEPLQLQKTGYGLSPETAVEMGFPNYYFDRYSNDQVENVTTWNHHLAAASYAWGGIAATPADAIRFYEALMNGHVVSDASLQQMINWFQGQGATDPEYGLGIEYWQFVPGSTPQRGHEGDGIGNTTMLLYVPDNDTYLFINCTVGRKFFGPYLFKVTDFKNDLARFVAAWR